MPLLSSPAASPSKTNTTSLKTHRIGKHRGQPLLPHNDGAGNRVDTQTHAPKAETERFKADLQNLKAP